MSYYIRIVSIFTFMLLASGCSDVVKSNYPTLQDAYNDDVFGRGWLPDVLPDSSNNIEVVNNLDLNTSVGEFHFNSSEFQIFMRKTKTTPIQYKYDGSKEYVDKRRSKGYVIRQYSSHATWVFMCKPEIGYCEYTMWSNS